MGSNDRMSKPEERTKRRNRQAVREILVWKAEYSEAMATLIEAMSLAGGYIGFGRTTKQDCLLLYVKLDDWKERIAIESYDQVLDTLADTLAEI